MVPPVDRNKGAGGVRRVIATVCVTVASTALAACGSPIAPTDGIATVDVLQYVIGDASLWPRVGSNSMSQIVADDRREVCWVKYSNPRRFECWRWDDEFVYHATDNAIDGNTGESYHFSDGRWLPRRITNVPNQVWTLDVARNQLTWFTPQCAIDPARSGSFPYRQRAWLESHVDAGGDLGVRDVLVLEYAPYDPASGRSNPERFYFAKGGGWYRWERGTSITQFVRVSGPGTGLSRDVWCQDSF
jgi:hypothetical protein